MSFRKEIRLFMQDISDCMKKALVGVEVYKDIIKELRKQNQDLLDRLAARNLPELKTFTLPEEESPLSEYKFQEDEDLAGEIYIPETDKSTPTGTYTQP